MIEVRRFANKIFTANQWAEGSWLAILRIGAGLALVTKIILELRYAGILYGSRGLIPVQILQYSENHMLPSLLNIYGWLGGPFAETQFLMLFFLCQLLFAAFLTLGFMTRLSALMCWMMQVIVFNSSHLISYGFDAVLLSLLFYSYIFPVGKYFSIDNKRRPAPYDTSMLPVYLKVIQLHICIIYFVNGMSKIGGQNWHDGSGIWDAVHQPQFESMLTPFLQKILMMKHLPTVVTWSTIFIEIAYPFMVWIRGANRLFFLAIILLHISIALVFGLWLFAFVMIVFNVAAFGAVLRPG